MASPLSSLAPEAVQFSEHPRWGMEGVIRFSAEHGQGIADWWANVLSGREIWAELPASGAARWRLLVKERQGDNRVLLAHPAEDEWVCTVALTRATHQALIDQLAGGQSVSVEKIASHHAPLSRISNAHLQFIRVE